MRAGRYRLVGLNRRYLDALLAVAITVELELECWLDHGIPDSHRLLTGIAVVVFAVPIAARRRWPAAALVCSAAVVTISGLFGSGFSAMNGLTVMLALAVLAYSAGALLELRRSLLALVLGAGTFCVFLFNSTPSLSSKIGTEVFVLSLVFVAPWFVARAVRERSRRVAAFGELAAQSAAEHDERQRVAIAQERERIGRELQDIIAHSVSAMVIQAGGARRLLRSHPEQARHSILAIEQTGREALADLRRLLGMLRKDDDPCALAPQPGLDQLTPLLDSMRDAGLACDLRSEGEPIDLTPGVDLVGYRVIEAALACAAQHRSRRAVVTIRYQPDSLELQIHGDGSMLDLDQRLRDLSERVALYDGNLRALPSACDQFALEAHLPLSTPFSA